MIASDPFELMLERALSGAFDSIQSWLRDQAMGLDAEGGKITTAAINVVRLDSTLRNLEQEMLSRGMSDVLVAQRDALEGVLANIREQAGEIDLPDTFSASSQTAIEMLLDGADRDLLALAGSASEQLATYLRRAVLGGGQRDAMLVEIAKILDLAESQARTLAITSLHAFHRLVTVTHARESGVTEYVYSGPDDAITRPWCSHWVGLRGTEDDIEATAEMWGHDKQPGPALVFGGGYNCRHEWLPVVGSQLDKYEQGPRQ